MLTVSCVSFLLDNSLQLLAVVFSVSLTRLLSNPSPFFFGESLLQMWWCPVMDLGLQFTPQIFSSIQVRALTSDVDLLEDVLHQEREVCFGSLRQKTKRSPRPRLAADCLRFSVQIFTYHPFFIPSTLMKFPIPDALKHSLSIILAPQSFTVGTVWVVHLFLPSLWPENTSFVSSNSSNLSPGCPWHI